MTDLIKRDDALAAIDTFNRDFEQSWKMQFSAAISALPAINLADRIEELEAALRKIAQHDMQAIATDALRPGERIRGEGK